MLKVLQLIPTLDRSGAEKQMVMLAAGLPRDRFKVEVAALTRLGPLEAELKAAGIPVTLIGKNLKLDPFALARLTRFVRRKKFDVVQTWIFAANVYGRIAAHRAKVPVVITAEMAVDLWKSPNHFWIDRKLANWTTRVVGNSQAVSDFYRDTVGIPESKLAVIPSGIDNAEPPTIDRAAVRASLGATADGAVVIFVGRLAPQKAVDDLLKALDLLQHVMPHLQTWIVGDGPLREQLQSTSINYDLRGKTHFLGHRNDVPSLLEAADLLVLPSLYEGLPNVVLEAMRFRKPVVATAAPGTTEVVEDGVTGSLVPLKNPPALAQAIRLILEDPAKAKAMGEAGRRRVEAHFPVSLMIDRFAQLYEQSARG